jgi:hypothetical protein
MADAFVKGAIEPAERGHEQENAAVIGEGLVNGAELEFIIRNVLKHVDVDNGVEGMPRADQWCCFGEVRMVSDNARTRRHASRASRELLIHLTGRFDERESLTSMMTED